MIWFLLAVTFMVQAARPCPEKHVHQQIEKIIRDWPKLEPGACRVIAINDTDFDLYICTPSVYKRRTK